MTAVTWRMIEAFRAVMLSGSVTGGAQLLHISQPSVSRLIHDLEEGTGLRLFERKGTRIQATDDGKALMDEVALSFAGLDRVTQAAARIRDRRRARLRVACMPVFAYCVLGEAVSRLMQRDPGLFVEVHVLASASAHELLHANRVDLAFALISENSGAGVPLRRYGGECACVLPQAHVLASGRRLKPADLRGQAFVALAPSSLTRMQVDAAFGRAGVQRSIVGETTQSLIACDWVRAGGCVSVVDPFAAEQHRSRGGAVRGFSPAIHFEVGCYSRKDAEASAPVRTLLQVLAAMPAAKPLA